MDARARKGIRYRLAAATVGLALALTLAGCSGKQTKEEAAEQPPAAPAAKGPVISVEGAWARPSAEGSMMSAAYFTVRNTGDEDDALVGASADVAGRAELHESRPATTESKAEGSMGGQTMGGSGGNDMAMEMVPVDRITVPAGGSVELKPGGLHVMLMDLKRPLAVGDRFQLTLRFEKSGEQTVEVEVRQP